MENQKWQNKLGKQMDITVLFNSTGVLQAMIHQIRVRTQYMRSNRVSRVKMEQCTSDSDVLNTSSLYYSVPICYGTGEPSPAWSSARAKELLTHLFAWVFWDYWVVFLVVGDRKMCKCS